MFNKLKKAFGFGGADDNDELIADDPDLQSSNSSPFSGEYIATEEISLNETESLTNEIFKHVVEQFNIALPGFLKDSVDSERQKKALYDSLADDVKTHLKNVEKNVVRQFDEAWRTEREKLQTDLKNISQTAKDIESKRAELKSQQLSSERQRRALQERIHDLEKQMATFEAEREQLELENKSMLNKVKVAQVYEKDMESMREQIADLQAQLNRKRVEGEETQAEPIVQIKEINPNPELLERISALETQNKELQQRNDELAQIEEEYNSMIEKMEQIEEQFSKIDEVTAAKDAKIDSLKKKLAEANETIARNASELEIAHAETANLRKDYQDALNRIEASERSQRKDESVTHERFDDMKENDDDDDILKDTDWIVQPSNKQKQDGPRTERTKVKRQSQIEDGQMSLW